MTPFALMLLLGVFTLSNVAFLMRAIASPALAVGLCVLLVGTVGLLFRGARQEPVGGRWTMGVAAAALAACVLGGAGHLMFTTEDWQVRDAVLHDLMRPTWPVLYGEGDQLRLLRAPLGFYMLPAAIGRMFGLAVAHLAVLAQNTAILTAVLLLYAREFTTTRSRLLGLIAVGLFSGWDLLGQATMALGAVAHGAPLPGGLHIERWGGLEYSSFVTDLFWAPNHGLPAFAFVGLYLAWRRQEVSAPALALFTGLSLLWSPLAVMGMTPLVAYALVRERREGRLDLRAFAIGASAAVAVLPILIFLQLDSHDVVSGFLLSDPEFPIRYLLLLGFEIGPILYLLLRRGLGRSGASPWELGIVAAMLLVIPIYSIGPSNDFVMRVSIAPLALAAVFVARRLADSLEAGRGSAVRTVAVLLAIGAVTPALETVRAFAHPATPPVTAPLPEAWTASVFRDQPRGTYFASVESLERYHGLLRPAPTPRVATAGRP